MLIVGAKGFAKELLEVIIQENPQAKIAFYDDVSKNLPELLFAKYPILKNEEAATSYLKGNDQCFALGIGNPRLRYQLYEKFVALGGNPTTVTSPFAHIGSFGTNIAQGCCITMGVVITNDVKIGIGCLLNLNSTVGHDSSLGDFCEISPGVHISGNVCVGNMCNLGTGAVILPRVKLGNNVTVGAGAVVTKDVADNMTVVGVPAKPYQSS